MVSISPALRRGAQKTGTPLSDGALSAPSSPSAPLLTYPNGSKPACLPAQPSRSQAMRSEALRHKMQSDCRWNQEKPVLD